LEITTKHSIGMYLSVEKTLRNQSHSVGMRPKAPPSPPEGEDVHPPAPAGGGEVACNFLNVVVEWCAAFAKYPPFGGNEGGY